MTGKRGHIDALTSLRFFAASAIVIHHIKWRFTFLEPLVSGIQLDLGVSFFYVLSGFVLYYNYPSLTTSSERALFIGARIMRIWPLHLAMLLFVIVAIPYTALFPVMYDAKILFLNTFLLQTWVPRQEYVFSFNGVSWSISCELFFYCTFPFLSALVVRRPGWAMLACVVAVAGICLLTSALGLDKGAWGAAGPSVVTFVLTFPVSRLPEFLLGVIAASRLRQVSALCRNTSRPWQTLIELSALAVALASAYYMPRLGWLLWSAGYIGAGARTWICASWSGPAFCILLLALAACKGYFNAILSWRPLVYLGNISFSIYMVHVAAFLTLIRSGFFELLPNGVIQLVAYVIILVLVAAFSHEMIELRAQRLWRRMSSGALHSPVSKAHSSFGA